jgi:hypothetical protein
MIKSEHVVINVQQMIVSIIRDDDFQVFVRSELL